jgi:hypothetical protein
MLQLSDPIKEYVPAAQAEHTLLFVAAITELLKPALQGVHSSPSASE